MPDLNLSAWNLAPGLQVTAPADSPLARGLDTVYGVLASPDGPGSGSLELSLQTDAQGMTVCLHGEPVLCLQDESELTPYLESALAEAVVDARQDCGVFHAGMVVLDGQGLMFPGERGAGKSTMSLHLAESGTYFGDDLVFIRFADRVIESFPKAVALKQGSFARAPEAPTFQDPMRGPIRYHLPKGAGQHTLPLAELAAVIFLEYGEGEGSLEPVDPEVAAMALLQQTAGGLTRNPRVLELLEALVEKPVYDLKFPDSAFAESAIREVLA